jgi:hypothetical protein
MNFIKKMTEGKKLLLIGVITGIFAIFVFTEFYGRIDILADKTLDPLGYYTKDTFYDFINLQGSIGRRGYLILHAFDYIFMFLLTLFLSGFLLRLTKIFTKVTLTNMAWLPILYLICDFTENLFIDISLLIFPSKILFLGHAAGYFTFFKFAILYLIFILSILLLFFNILILFLKKISNRES